MRLKKLLLVSTCALAIGAGTTIGSDSLLSESNIVHAQEETTSTEVNTQLLAEIKNNLAGVQPVNLEQLLEVDDQYLIDLYDTATTQAETDTVNDVWKTMYDQLAIDYAQLNLLTGENLQAYNDAAENIIANSQYSYSDLNTALPSDILGWYNSALLENNDDIQATVETILPQITQAREAYILRRDEREDGGDDGNGQTPAPEDEFTAAISEYTDITEEQLSQFTEEEIEPIKIGAQNGEYSQDTMDIIRDQIIQLNPDVFTAEQVSSVASDIRNAFIESTPATQEQLDQLDDTYLVRMVGEGNHLGADIGWAYNTAVYDNPEVFGPEATRFRDTLVADFNLNEDQLLSVPDAELLWQEFSVFQENNMEEDIEALAVAMQENFDITVDGDTPSDSSSSEESSDEESSESDESEPISELDTYREELVSQTDLTIEQLNQFSDEHLTNLMDRLGLSTESTSSEELNALRDELVIAGYDNFSGEQLTSAIAPVREAVINQTPATEGILNEFEDRTYAEWYNAAKNAGEEVPNYIFEQLVTMYPNMFNDLVTEAKQNIVQNTSITQEQIDQMQFEDILWAVQPNETGEVNYVDVTNYLAERYPEVISGGDSETPGESSEDTEQSASSVDVSISSSVEENEENLPNTGESSTLWIIILAAVALVGGGIYLLVSGRRSKH
ncbi:LPXTG cell wall anchor domain-containing protein [Aerococcaceae bacterium DSM 111021]|nr:LPXTG cell wall anchor domain-containing protein [Aerococcaceae bacterium DSM 111021]